MAAVQAAALVGALGWLVGQLSLLEARVHPASLYCEAFAGMHLDLPRILVDDPAGNARRYRLLAVQAFLGGHRRQTGYDCICRYHNDRCAGTLRRIQSSKPRAHFRRCLPEVCHGRCSHRLGLSTYWLSEHRKFGAVCASAVPTTLLVLGTKLLDPSWQMKSIPLVAAWLGASFAGMTSAERLARQHWMLPLVG